MAWDLLLLLEAAAPAEVPSCASLAKEFGAAAPLSTVSAYPASVAWGTVSRFALCAWDLLLSTRSLSFGALSLA